MKRFTLETPYGGCLDAQALFNALVDQAAGARSNWERQQIARAIKITANRLGATNLNPPEGSGMIGPIPTCKICGLRIEHGRAAQCPCDRSASWHPGEGEYGEVD